jgi:hypothetical protein
MVAIAQLVEHGIVIPGVAGSSPVGHPNFLTSEIGSPPKTGAVELLLATIGLARILKLFKFLIPCVRFSTSYVLRCKPSVIEFVFANLYILQTDPLNCA